MIFRDKTVVPAMMFHSVGLEKANWVWSHISEPVRVFEEKLVALRSKGYRSVTWEQLYQHMAGIQQLPKNSIFLTFDDGYLDNWVYVFPLLRKYELKGTIYINPDFVQRENTVRPNLDDVWSGHLSEPDLQVQGFLTWEEMRLMESSGVIDIQSHSLTHTWYFSGPQLQDYYRKEDTQRYPWMAWNLRPDRKPYYLSEDQSDFVEPGTPIFQHEKSLVVRKFVPDEKATEKIRKYIQSKGVETFWKNDHWLVETMRTLGGWYPNGMPGTYESDYDRISRVRFELQSSKEQIERNLNKKVDYICWPGGGNDEFVWRLAREVGYKSWTLGSQDKSEFRNSFDSDPETVKRIGSSNEVRVRSKYYGQGGALFMELKIGAHQKSLLYKLMVWIYKLCFIFKSRFWFGYFSREH